MTTLSFALEYTIGSRAMRSSLDTDAERIAIVGPSGIGKTTLLRALLGLVPSRGAITLRGERIETRAIEARHAGWVPQDGALFPHLDVYENLAFGSTEKPMDRIAELVGASALMRRSVEALSGGERQRVAIGRALARRPRLLVLDEPLSALDRDARSALSSAIETERAARGAMLVLASHDESDVRALADEVYVMSADGMLTRHALAQKTVQG